MARLDGRGLVLLHRMSATHSKVGSYLEDLCFTVVLSICDCEAASDCSEWSAASFIFSIEKVDYQAGELWSRVEQTNCLSRMLREYFVYIW